MKASYSKELTVHMKLWLVSLFIVFALCGGQEPPRITIVVVIDQFAYYELQKLLPFCTKGIRLLHDKGICYSNALQPQAYPVTGPGHAALATGTTGADHGIVANRWPNEQRSSMVYCDDDISPGSSIFAPHGFYAQGASSKALMVDTLSDQLMLNSSPGRDFTVYSFSMKSDVAVLMAGKLGRAIWFDEQAGQFTSSKAYFKEALPSWLNSFNKEHSMKSVAEITWQLVYPRKNAAYNFPFVGNYTYAELPPLAGKTITFDYKSKTPYDIVSKVPYATSLLFTCVKKCIDEFITAKKTERLVLWVGVSNLDPVGHAFGPDSLEAIDTIYHIDADLMELMQYVQQVVQPDESLFVLTADHGVAPIVEQLQQQGFAMALRINESELIMKLNSMVNQKYGIKKLIIQSEFPHMYFDREQFEKLPKNTRSAVIKDLKTMLYAQRGIKEVWTFDELYKMPFPESSREQLFKNQLYRDRSGDMIVCVLPYVVVTNTLKGTGHGAPYDYDRHVPLLLYSPLLAPMTVTQKVDVTQLPTTLAHLLQVPPPSAARGELLPGVVHR
jgi:predicted AlkP superfamily pyrophosphatase or phosphodiesterase